MDKELVPRPEQMTGHGPAHDSESDETKLHDFLPCLIYSVAVGRQPSKPVVRVARGLYSQPIQPP